jgi:Ner family transcriptional regulator
MRGESRAYIAAENVGVAFCACIVPFYSVTMPFVMQNTDSQKTPAAPADWHPADIIAALWKARTTMRRLSRQNHYASASLNVALRHPWARAEAIIAAAIGVTPQTIWPSRYHPDGRPKRGSADLTLVRSTTKYRASRPASGRARKAA